jgi:hypothetical protein
VQTITIDLIPIPKDPTQPVERWDAKATLSEDGIEAMAAYGTGRTKTQAIKVATSILMAMDRKAERGGGR